MKPQSFTVFSSLVLALLVLGGCGAGSQAGGEQVPLTQMRQLTADGQPQTGAALKKALEMMLSFRLMR